MALETESHIDVNSLYVLGGMVTVVLMLVEWLYDDYYFLVLYNVS